MSLPQRFWFNIPFGALFSALISLIDRATKRLAIEENKKTEENIRFPTLFIKRP